MSGVKLFVDTNILLYFLKGNREVTELIADNDLSISFITELELLSFPQLKNRDKTGRVAFNPEPKAVIS